MNQDFRLYSQAYETLFEIFVFDNVQDGDIIQPYNIQHISSGICPTITTRPEGLKTAIFVVREL